MTKKYRKMTEITEFFDIKFLPENVSINVKKGTTILEAIEKAGLSIDTECGGYGSCGKCKVKIIKGSFKKHKHIKLSEEEVKDNIQLACLTEIVDDIEVYIQINTELEVSKPPQKEKILYKSEFIKDSAPFIFNYKPLSEQITLKIDLPNIDNNPDDFERIKMKLRDLRGADDIRCPISVLKKIPDELRKKDGLITLTISESNNLVEIINISAFSEKKYNYGLAVDIGTTTVAVQLANLSEGKVISESSEYNQQILYGADVINRIVYASKEGGLAISSPVEVSIPYTMTNSLCLFTFFSLLLSFSRLNLPFWLILFEKYRPEIMSIAADPQIPFGLQPPITSYSSKPESSSIFIFSTAPGAALIPHFNPPPSKAGPAEQAQAVIQSELPSTISPFVPRST